MDLKQLFVELDYYDDTVPLGNLISLLHQLNITISDLEQYIHYSDNRYQRNLVGEGPAYQVLALCWKNGQRSPIHDHKGSTCAVRVFEGVASETFFETAPNGLIYASKTEHWESGSITGSEDMDIHQISNLQLEPQNLVTIHIYSPSLNTMGMYSLERREVVRVHEPILGSGAGI